MIAVAVADHRVLDLSRIEPELFQAADDFVLDRVVPDRVDDDDARRSRYRPRRVFFFPDEIEIVENLRRLDVPRIARGRSLHYAGVRPGRR
jgi:hypothetical protein